MVRELLTLNTIEKKAILGLMAAIFIFAGAYVYFVNQTVVNVVQRRAIERDIDAVNTKVSQLAFEYIELKNSITREEGLSRGFYEVGNPLFVSRDTALTLSLNNN